MPTIPTSFIMENFKYIRDEMTYLRDKMRYMANLVDQNRKEFEVPDAVIESIQQIEVDIDEVFRALRIL